MQTRRQSFLFSAEGVRRSLQLPSDADICGLQYLPRKHAVVVYMVGGTLPPAHECEFPQEEERNGERHE